MLSVPRRKLLSGSEVIAVAALEETSAIDSSVLSVKNLNGTGTSAGASEFPTLDRPLARVATACAGPSEPIRVKSSKAVDPDESGRTLNTSVWEL